MLITISKPTLIKQLTGGLAGIAIAMGMYAVVQNVDLLSVRAILIQPGSMFSTNAGKVTVSNKNVDPATVERLKKRAQQVAAALNTAGGAIVAQSALSSAPAVSAQLISVQERLATRIAKAREEKLHAAAPQPLHSGADLQNIDRSSRLSDSGPLLNAIIVISAGLAGMAMVRRRRFAFLSR